MKFIDIEHENFYNEKIGQVKTKDVYTNVLIYLLASNRETRNYFSEIYSLEKNEIYLESLQKPWQTGTSLNICRLAFNLFGDIVSDTPEEGTSYLYTTSQNIRNLNLDCCIEALKIRFGVAK